MRKRFLTSSMSIMLSCSPCQKWGPQRGYATVLRDHVSMHIKIYFKMSSDEARTQLVCLMSSVCRFNHRTRADPTAASTRSLAIGRMALVGRVPTNANRVTTSKSLQHASRVRYPAHSYQNHLSTKTPFVPLINYSAVNGANDRKHELPTDVPLPSVFPSSSRSF